MPDNSRSPSAAGGSRPPDAVNRGVPNGAFEAHSESRRRDSNPGPPLYESGALPAELRRQMPRASVADPPSTRSRRRAAQPVQQRLLRKVAAPLQHQAGRRTYGGDILAANRQVSTDEGTSVTSEVLYQLSYVGVCRDIVVLLTLSWIWCSRGAAKSKSLAARAAAYPVPGSGDPGN